MEAGSKRLFGQKQCGEEWRYCSILGGILEESLRVDLITISNKLIDVQVQDDPSSLPWRITFIYGEPRVEDRHLTWEIMKLRNEQYSLLAVMGELSTVRCDRVFVLWAQVHGRQVSTVSCRGDAWPMDRAVDGGEGQPGPELGRGSSCRVHSWIEGVSSEG